MKFNFPSHFSDADLLAELKQLARREREATVELVAHLAVLDSRQFFLGAGCSSTFTYCVEVLRLSEHSTYNRIEAARAALKFPIILDRLREGSLNLSTVRSIAPHLTEANHRELIERASGKSKRTVEEIVAALAPRPDVRSVIRALPPGNGATALPLTVLTGPSIPDLAAPSPPECGPVVSKPTSVMRPLAPDRYEVKFTASAATCEKLRRAKDLLRHAVPSGDTAEIVDRALMVLLEQLERKKFGTTKRPRTAGDDTRTGSRHIPAAVRRAVSRRDGERCTFVGEGGRRCSARGFLEFHHLKPYAVGGPATVANLTLRCVAHNRYEAAMYYGPLRSYTPQLCVSPNSPRGELSHERSSRGSSAEKTSHGIP
jgi:hypothetical protein